MNNLIEVVNLNKFFSKKHILKDVSFNLHEGEILGLIGPNGAGKSTLIKCILGLLHASSGDVFINGYDIKKDFSKAIKRVGAIVESPDSYTYLSGRENLKIYARIYGASLEKVDEVIKISGLEKRIDDKVKKYSLGMKGRLGLAIALINDPNVLILDEPMNGLDPEGVRDLRNLLIKLSKKGVGIIISSHNIKELESFCTNICLIQNGKVIADSTISNLKKSDKTMRIFTISETKGIKKIFPNAEIINDTSFKLELSDDEVPDVVKKLSKDYLIYDIKKEEISLEDVFIDKIGGNVID